MAEVAAAIPSLPPTFSNSLRDGARAATVTGFKEAGDLLPPTFSGASSATSIGPVSLVLNWPAAVDLKSPQPQIDYLIWYEEGGAPNLADPPAFITDRAAVSYQITGLAPETTYHFVVKARDQAGNVSTNTAALVVDTIADATPPTFGGVQKIASLADPTPRILLSWFDASGPPSGIGLYRVFKATVSGGQNFAGADATTPSNQPFYEDTDVTPGVEYFYVVRASNGSDLQDSNTNEVSATAQLTPDTSAPVISNLAPPAGTAIAPGDAITFTITDNRGFRRIMVLVTQDGEGVEEVAHDGNAFRGFYQTVSSREIVAGGWSYSIRRVGGWTSNPSIRVFGFDTSGNEGEA